MRRLLVWTSEKRARGSELGGGRVGQDWVKRKMGLHGERGHLRLQVPFHLALLQCIASSDSDSFSEGVRGAWCCDLLVASYFDHAIELLERSPTKQS